MAISTPAQKPRGRASSTFSTSITDEGTGSRSYTRLHVVAESGRGVPRLAGRARRAAARRRAGGAQRRGPAGCHPLPGPGRHGGGGADGPPPRGRGGRGGVRRGGGPGRAGGGRAGREAGGGATRRRSPQR